MWKLLNKQIILLAAESESLCFVTNCMNALYAGFENVGCVKLTAFFISWVDVMSIRPFWTS